MKPDADLKPLPCGNHRLRCFCTCGRRIPSRELIELVCPPRCPDCGGTMRRWERIPTGPIAHLRAWAALYFWKRRHRVADSH